MRWTYEAVSDTVEGALHVAGVQQIALDVVERKLLVAEGKHLTGFSS